MVTNAFNISLSVFQNRCWVQSFSLFNADETPLDVSQDSLALVVLPAVPGPSTGTPPVLANASPAVSVNVVTFDTPDSAMGTLMAGKNYSWQFLRQPSGEQNCSSVVCAGPLLVQDSPPFPAILPH